MRVHIFGGGTVSYVRNHLALSAPAWGGTARRITQELILQDSQADARLELTRMGGGTKMVTNSDVAARVAELVADPLTRVIFMSAALCDYDGQIGEVESGPHADRLHSSAGVQTMRLTPADKVIGAIRKERKDIFVVGFKTTTGATPEQQYSAALHLLKSSSVNLVLANDTVTRHNMIVTPEETHYGGTTDREAVLAQLVRMTLARCTNTFTRTEVVSPEGVTWGSDTVPQNLRRVVEHCIKRGAYKPFRGATVGHFAYRLDDKTIVTSRRKDDFNLLPERGMVRLEDAGGDRMLASGGKPSVGGQSQRIIFAEHEDAECIVHFHCPPRPVKGQPAYGLAAQWPNECGSHQCGANTSRNLVVVEPGLKAVMLDNHGPNIVFNRHTDPDRVIQFIEENWDLEAKTGGFVPA